MTLAEDSSTVIFLLCISICRSHKRGHFLPAWSSGASPIPECQGHKSCRTLFSTENLLNIFCFFMMLGRWAGWDVSGLQCQGHGARAELQTANTTFGIQSAHLTTGPWKQVLEPYGKQLELPSRLQAFANVKKKKRDEVTCLGNWPLWFSLRYYARTAFCDGVLPLVACVTLSLGKQR